MALPLAGHRRPWDEVDRPLAEAVPIVFVDMDGNYVQSSASPCDMDQRLQLRRRPSPRCEKEHVVNPGSSLSSFKEFLDSIALPVSDTAAASRSSAEEVTRDTNVISPHSRRCLFSTILVRRLPDWGLIFYIRVDCGGDFHTYPHLGGPFQSLQEANIAIDCHLDDRKDTKMFKKQEGVSQVEMAIRRSLYWLDGTKKKCSKSQIIERNHDQIRLLVQALVDMYNEDHNLLGDLAYELKDVLHYQFISESHSTIPKKSKYYHLNFTMKTKRADDFDCDTGDLFFVEIKLMQGEHEELAVSRFCIVEPNDNGHCYGCANNGSAGIKHPNNSYAYAGGHVNTYLPFEWSDSEDNVDEEARIRHIYKGVGSV